MMRKLSFLLVLLILASMPAAAYTDYSEYTGSEYEHDPSYEGSIIVNGVDASYYQDVSSDWASAKASGIDFAIFRITLTYANSGRMEDDSSFEEHYKKAGEAGLMRGVYVFSQALNAEEGREEAAFAVRRLRELNIGPDDLDLPVYMDYEFLDKNSSRLKDLSPEDAAAAAKAFCEEIQQNGYTAGVYANTGFFRNYLYDGVYLPEGTALWCAQYNETNDSLPYYSMWQYSSSGTVPYIYQTGSENYSKVDVNFWYIDTVWWDQAEMTVEYDIDQSYTGLPVMPEINVYYGDERLEEGKDYIVKGISNVEAGEDAYAYIRGKGNYEGYILAPFNINNGEINSGETELTDTARECTYRMHRKSNIADKSEQQ